MALLISTTPHPALHYRGGEKASTPPNPRRRRSERRPRRSADNPQKPEAPLAAPQRT